MIFFRQSHTIEISKKEPMNVEEITSSFSMMGKYDWMKYCPLHNTFFFSLQNKKEKKHEFATPFFFFPPRANFNFSFYYMFFKDKLI